MAIAITGPVSYCRFPEHPDRRLPPIAQVDTKSVPRSVRVTGFARCQNCGAPGQRVLEPCQYCQVVVAL